MADSTDFRGLLRTLDRVKDAKQVQHAADMHAIRSLARGVQQQLDGTFAELFKAAA